MLCSRTSEGDTRWKALDRNWRQGAVGRSSGGSKRETKDQAEKNRHPSEVAAFPHPDSSLRSGAELSEIGQHDVPSGHYTAIGGEANHLRDQSVVVRLLIRNAKFWSQVPKPRSG